MKLYVGNISFTTSNEDLAEAFGQHGTVTSAQVVMDRETGRSRGFAFVEMSDGAEAAIAAMHGANFMGRTLTVNEARPREDRGVAAAVAAVAGTAAAAVVAAAAGTAVAAAAGTKVNTRG